MKYYISEIASRQYFLEDGQSIDVENLATEEKFLMVKTLLSVDGEKVEIGTPYLNKDLKMEILSTGKGNKIRVAIYKAKANNRRVVGSRRIISKVRLVDSVKGNKVDKKVVKKA